jgi:hypothetical protein
MNLNTQESPVEQIHGLPRNGCRRREIIARGGSGSPRAAGVVPLRLNHALFAADPEIYTSDYAKVALMLFKQVGSHVVSGYPEGQIVLPYIIHTSARYQRNRRVPGLEGRRECIESGLGSAIWAQAAVRYANHSLAKGCILSCLR